MDCSALLLVTALAVCSYRQTSHWRDSVTLWRHVVENTSANSGAENSLGKALLDRREVTPAIRLPMAAKATEDA